MDWYYYILTGFVLAGLIFISAVYAFHWALKNGQLKDLEKGASSIFDDDEPLREQTDYSLSKSNYNLHTTTANESSKFIQ